MTREMPRYQSHKKVHALKMKSVRDLPDGAGEFVPEEPGYATVALSAEYMTKHRPQAGGYYVVYPDGYTSWSPAEAFESGYTPLDGTTATDG